MAVMTEPSLPKRAGVSQPEREIHLPGGQTGVAEPSDTRHRRAEPSEPFDTRHGAIRFEVSFAVFWSRFGPVFPHFALSHPFEVVYPVPLYAVCFLTSQGVAIKRDCLESQERLSTCKLW